MSGYIGRMEKNMGIWLKGLYKGYIGVVKKFV